MKAVQLDLFGEVEAAEQAAANRVQAAADWAARFEQVPWVAPWDTAGGMKKGDSCPGWRCPSCGDIEPNTFLLGINHGYDPETPGDQPWQGWGTPCVKQQLEAAHAVYDARRAEVRDLAGQGLDDEQIAAQVGFWDAASIAGFRKEDAKAARRRRKESP